MTTASPPIVTARQRRILRWIADYIAAFGFSPTTREGMTAFGFKSPNGWVCHTDPLRRKGLVEWVGGRSRTLRVTTAGMELLAEVANGN